MRTLLRTLIVCAAAALLPSAQALAGQISGGDFSSTPSVPSTSVPTSGWSLTPSLLYSRTWDDNVLLRAPGDQTIEDFINVINPRGELSYHGRLTDFSARYDGAFVLYRRSDALNSYDQHGGVTGKRRLSKRNTLLLSANAQQSPTTELLQFIGVPFIRVGSFSDDVSVGVETLVNKRLTVVTSANFQQARFDQNQTFATMLLGGSSVGAAAGLRERISARTTLTADFDAQHATIGAEGDVFDIVHGIAGIDHQLSQNLHVFAAGGFSRLNVSSFGPPRLGPSWRLGLSDHYRSTIIDLVYSRSYVPSFGFGGTMQNEEASASVKMPLSRRFYVQGIVSRRIEDPLVFTFPQLRSIWVQGSVGYTTSTWVRIEGFYAGTRQTTVVPDQMLSHDQIGVQVIASKPVRIR
jgi:hypothetical protein